MVEIDIDKVKPIKWYLARGKSVKKAVTDSKGNRCYYDSYGDAVIHSKKGDIVCKERVPVPWK